MARDLICPACGKFGFKSTEIFVTGESASLKCVLCGEWSAQPKWKTVAMLIAEVEKLEAECKERVAEKMEWLTERNKLQSSLTRSKAEGRREAFEEAAKIAEEWRGTMSMFLHAEDCRAHNTACGQIAAAIRQQTGHPAEEKSQIRNEGFATTEYNLSLACEGPPLTKRMLYDVVLVPKQQY